MKGETRGESGEFIINPLIVTRHMVKPQRPEMYFLVLDMMFCVMLIARFCHGTLYMSKNLVHGKRWKPEGHCEASKFRTRPNSYRSLVPPK